MKLHRYVDHQRLHIVTKDVISLSISVLLLFRHYISHKITFGAPSSGGVLHSACGAFIPQYHSSFMKFLIGLLSCREPLSLSEHEYGTLTAGAVIHLTSVPLSVMVMHH